jgi:WD40 repeat protein
MSTKYQFGIVFALLLSITACSSVSTPPNIPALPAAPPAPQTIEEGFLQTHRVSAGTPLFNKIPYLNRLFSETAIRYDYVWDTTPFLSWNSSAAISSDGKWLLVGKSNGGGVSLWNLHDPKDCHPDIVPSIEKLTASTEEGSNTTQDTSKVTVTITVLEQGEGTRGAWLQFTPDASAFLVFRRRWKPSEVETMTLHDRASGQELRAIPIEPKFQVGAISPDGELLLAVGAASLEYWNLRSGQKVASAPLGNLGEVTDIQCTPDQRFVFLASRFGTVDTVHVFDFHTLREITSIPGNDLKSCIAISPNGQTLAVVLFDAEFESRIQIYEIGTWKLLREIRPKNKDPYEHEPDIVRFSRDGKSLLALGSARYDGKREITLKQGLFGYDLDQPNGTWTEIEYKTLPLHPEGKYLLDGQFGSAVYLSPFTEILVPDFKMNLRSKNNSEN